MNAERLLAHFDRIADAPDAVARLRRFILDLAVRGKLVPQEPAAEPASSLLSRIATEKARLVETGQVRERKSYSPDVHDVFFDLPMGWHPASLDQVIDELQTGPFGSSLHQSDYQVGGTPVINPASIQNERLVPIDKMAVGPATLERLATFRLKARDIVIGRRGEMGRCAVVSEREHGWLCGTGSLILRPSRFVYPRFLALLIGSPVVRAYLGGSAVGSTMQNLNQAILLNLAFGLPPFSEQQRIVAKVDELMILCAQLEAVRAEREAKRETLATVSFAHLNTPDPDPARFANDARFALDILPTLTARRDQIRQLRQTILNLAVRGRLVPQERLDEPASEWLDRVSAEKTQRKLETRDRRIGSSKRPDLTQLPFDIPTGWSAESFENLFLFIDYRGQTPPKTTSGVPLITAKNIRMGFLNREPQEFVSEDTHKRWMTRGFPRIGDLFFTTEAPLANVCINNVDGPFALAQRVICLQPFVKTNTTYLMIAMMSDIMQTLIDQHATGLTAKGIKAAKLKPLPLPIPPVPEQERIVHKVSELTALCDRLEANLSNAETTRSLVLEALLADALAPVAREISVTH
jgi:type I restriction enzyme S subunit